MQMTFLAFDCLTEQLLKIENIDPTWLPDEQDIQECIDANREEDVAFLLWLSLTVNTDSKPESVNRKKAVMRKLYDTLFLTD